MTSQVRPFSATVGASSRLYELWVSQFPPQHFEVHSFTARESLSGWYRFDIEITAAESASAPVNAPIPPARPTPAA